MELVVRDVFKSWGAPILLGAICAAPFIGSAPADAASLLKALRSGRCDALAILATHHPEELTPELMRELATHEDHRLRELVAHQDWIPHIPLRDQLKVCATLEPRELRDRARIWSERRTTSRETLTRSDIVTYWQKREP